MSAADLPQILRLIMALVFVLALMGGLALALKKLGLTTGTTVTGKKRLKLVETLALDSRRRLALIQRDDKQHLVIFGPSGETLIETNITPKEQNEDTAP